MRWNRTAKPKECRMLDIQTEVDTVRTWVISPALHVSFSEINYALDPSKAPDDSICLLGHLNLAADMYTCRYLWAEYLHLHDLFAPTQQGHLGRSLTPHSSDHYGIWCKVCELSLCMFPATSECTGLFHSSRWQTNNTSTTAFQCSQFLYNMKCTTNGIHLISQWQPHCSQTLYTLQGSHNHPLYRMAVY